MSLISHRKSLVTHTSLGNISPLQVKSCDLLPRKKYRGRTLVDFPTNSGFQWQFLIWQDLKGKTKEPKYIQNMCLKRSIFRRRRIGTHTYIYISFNRSAPKMTLCVYYIYIYVYNVYNISIYIYMYMRIYLYWKTKKCVTQKNVGASEIGLQPRNG